MTTQDRIDAINKQIQTIVDKKGQAAISDGHCTFGVEYPPLSKKSEGVTYFSILDLHGRFSFTGKTMKEVLERVERHLHDKHGL